MAAPRFLFMFVVGALAYGGVDFAFDLQSVIAGQRTKISRRGGSMRSACCSAGSSAGAFGWYFDAAPASGRHRQVLGLRVGRLSRRRRQLGDFVTYPIFNKYGMMNLGQVAGGIRLFWAESVAGVINWSLAAPLFSINYVLLDAAFRRTLRPLKTLFSPEGVEGLVEQAVRVLRWGLWMAPIINSFLRQSPDPTWYNQDGAVRSAVAIGADVTQSPADFRRFSLLIFLGLLAYDWLRVLIWFDHMGLQGREPRSICRSSAATGRTRRRRASSATRRAPAPFPTAFAVSAPGRR